ncbi:cupredoxin domain-containing protein [Simplicispira psychrophila]|uniref:cupredoxin domain-containing protein n=1 Tax=Simplicispira psychrophila TaxID=80882 RepID=UPI000567FC75|nr:cupredoxin family copper-binding protein [Simplicispira psychrophila]
MQRTAAVVLALGGAWTLALAPAVAETHTIVMENMRFTPDTLTLRRGDSVVWRNDDLVPHTASAAKVFDSGSIEPGKSWSTVLRKAGSVPYVCTFHPGMKATLTVE